MSLTVRTNRISLNVGQRVVSTGAAAGATSITEDTELAASQNGRKINNTGATGAVVATLPDSDDLTVGWTIHARVTAAQMLAIEPQGSDVLRVDSIDVALLQSNSRGSCISIEYVGGGVFFVTAPPTGTWSDNT